MAINFKPQGKCFHMPSFLRNMQVPCYQCVVRATNPRICRGNIFPASIQRSWPWRIRQHCRICEVEFFWKMRNKIVIYHAFRLSWVFVYCSFLIFQENWFSWYVTKFVEKDCFKIYFMLTLISMTRYMPWLLLPFKP